MACGPPPCVPKKKNKAVWGNLGGRLLPGPTIYHRKVRGAGREAAGHSRPSETSCSLDLSDSDERWSKGDRMRPKGRSSRRQPGLAEAMIQFDLGPVPAQTTSRPPVHLRCLYDVVVQAM